MPDESLIAAAEPDRFTHESPIRAFTEFRVAGTWAIGKGFRPSLAHMHTYLDAMQHKEGWHLVQMLDGGSLDPTLIFQRDRIMAMTIPERSYTVEGPKKPLTMDEIDEHFRSIGFALIATPEGHLRYEPERKIEETVIDANDRVVGKHPALAAPYGGQTWMQHGSDEEIPREHRMAAAEYVIGRALNAKGSGHAVEAVVRDFKKRFMSTKTTQVSHTTLAQQLHFLMNGVDIVRIKQLIDGFREEHRLGFREPYKDFAAGLEFQGFNQDVEETVIDANDRVPNVGDDPINPAYYDGTACAEIIEHMPTNVGITAKYIWRLGEKDAEKQECGKAAWYLKRELAMLDETVDHGHGRAKFGFASPSDCAWYRKYADERINAAQKGGKLTTWRATAMSALVSYTITGEASFLHTVIGFLEGSECFKEYGNGLAI